MKIKDNKCKCGHNDFFFADKGNQKGIYCSYCGKWLKWADKDERNLMNGNNTVGDEKPTEKPVVAEKQESVEQMKQALDRAKVLLKATYDILQKQEESPYVLNVLETTAEYDGTECDGNCLEEDIENWFVENFDEWIKQRDLSRECKGKYKDCVDCILNKIRTEIIQMPTISLNANDIYKADVLAIIDKYKAESEE